MHYLALVLLLLLPGQVSAQVIINEIMYDLEGTDGKREWIEIHNTGSEAQDLSSWKFFENDSNHKLSVSLGNAVVPPGGFAIIADNADTFLSEHAGFKGTVFDSSFSLKNTGELLILRDADQNDIDSVSYLSDWGAAGDGNSLQKANGSWIANSPTPGGATVATLSSEPTLSTENDSDDDGTSSVQKKREFITVSAGSDRTVTVGAAEFFEAEAFTTNGERHPYTTYRWNFGNGVLHEGKRVLHQYNHPGTYVVLVSGITADKLAATDRMTVTAEPANLTVSNVTPAFIEIINGSNRELDLSLWSLRAGDAHFLFPKNTIIASGASVTFPNTATGLYTSGISDVALLYPNGMTAAIYGVQSAHQSSPISRVQVVNNSPSRVTVEASPDATIAMPSEIPEEQTASVATLMDETNTLFLWLLALLGVIGAAVLVLLSLREKEPEMVVKDQKEKLPRADEFDIVED